MTDEWQGRTLELDGAVISYSELPGDGPVIVYAHGLSSSRSADDRRGIIDFTPITESGRRFIRYDARGHGRSTGRAVPDDYLWDRLADDLLALADAVSPDEPIVVFGTSMGTGTALHAVAKRPDRISALVLSAVPTAWELRAAQAGLYEQFATAVETNGAEYLESMLENAPAVPIFADLEVEQFGPDIPEALQPSVFRGAARTDFPSRDIVARTTTPTLVLSWDTDPSHPVSVGAEVHSLIAASEFRVAETSAEVRTWGAAAADFVAALAER
ncbi:alpha/beta fold hydrolase [Gryllotalpicola reticulitermitis]|uniref:Alpha/beta fold hydrolase n=1 Tax=Gryllotalpicola reticulitermitis TaxID=1184153 RepID=A0ABV8Q5E6_9MICO